MSFFDEDDEPQRTEIRSQSRPQSRRRPSGSGGSGSGRSGGRRRPPSGPTQQSVNTRRAIAVVAVVVVIVLIAIGVNSCESSSNKSALQNYADNVDTIISSSDASSAAVFKALSGANSSNSSTVGQTIATARAKAEQLVSRAQHWSVPGSARTANSHLVLALQMRQDGLAALIDAVGSALGSSGRQQAVQDITAQMARFYASDILYKSYTAPELVSALHGSGIAVGGADGTQINSGQFLPSIQWLQPSYVGALVGVAVSTKSGSSGGGKVTGLHGDDINSVSVGGATLSNGAVITSSPPPTFQLSFSNGGNFTETDVICKVTVPGTSIAAQSIVSSIAKGETKTCDVTLKSAPPAGNYNLVAAISRVPGETNVANNRLSYPVTFK